jgi:hypothetical protein
VCRAYRACHRDVLVVRAWPTHPLHPHSGPLITPHFASVPSTLPLPCQFETKARSSRYPGMAVTLPTTAGSMVIEEGSGVLTGTMVTDTRAVGDVFVIRKGRQ